MKTAYKFNMKKASVVALCLGVLALPTISLAGLDYSSNKPVYTKVVDVLSLANDPKGFIFTFPVTGTQAGSRFLAQGQIYPGYTFNTNGPFTTPPIPKIGDWFCDGTITGNDVIAAPTTSVPVGFSTVDFQFIDAQGNDNSVFAEDTLKTIDARNIATGQPTVTASAVILNGLNANSCINGRVQKYLYIDANGNQLVRFVFQKPIVVSGVTLINLCGW